MLLNCLAVGAGGFIGAVCRYGVGLLPLRETTLFPVKTLAVNLLGCFMIGIIATLAMKNLLPSLRWGLFLQTGICGGFTTFSTFALETNVLLRNGHAELAVLYVFLSVILGLGLTAAAQVWLGK